jgi:hypothetical protein
VGRSRGRKAADEKQLEGQKAMLEEERNERNHVITVDRLEAEPGRSEVPLFCCDCSTKQRYLAETLLGSGGVTRTGPIQPTFGSFTMFLSCFSGYMYTQEMYHLLN